jgi:hypothetical protein
MIRCPIGDRNQGVTIDCTRSDTHARSLIRTGDYVTLKALMKMDVFIAAFSVKSERAMDDAVA